MTAGKEKHYQATFEFHQKAALEKNGFYDSTANSHKHHSAQLWVRKNIMELLRPIAGENCTILDAGCGNGDFSIKILNCFPDSQITGLDCVDEMIAIGEKTAEGKINFIKGDLRQLPLADNSFDIVICNNVLHHIFQDDQERTLNELARVTKNYLILEIKNKNNLYNLIRKKKVGNLNVYPATVKKVKNILAKRSLKLTKSVKILFFNFLSPWLVLKFKKTNYEF